MPAPANPAAPPAVLVVDDDPLIVAVVRVALSRIGCQILEAGSSEEALQAAAACAHPIHLLIADFSLARMNGPELSRRLQEMHPGLRVLCITGHSREQLVADGLLDASVPFLGKPWRITDLVNKVTELLERRRPNSQ